MENNTLCHYTDYDYKKEKRRLRDAEKLLAVYCRDNVSAKNVKKILGHIGYKVDLGRWIQNTIRLTDTYINRFVIVEI